MDWQRIERKEQVSELLSTILFAALFFGGLLLAVSL